jgi:DNA-directed RNA polymerase subunit RPC12/RpoP
MRGRTPDMFGVKPRDPRKWLMHVCDAGGDGEEAIVVRFLCARCKNETDWMHCDTITEAKRGIPCVICNAKPVTE